MLNKIIQWSGRNPFLILLATLAIVIGGVVAVIKTPLDALPDLSDVQVIVYTEYPGQAPQVVEDQVTYPLTTAMLAVPKSKVVRGFSFFGASFVYVIFEDGTDIYWARTRVLEYLNFASGRLPKGVTPTLGPDATGVGWVYQYVLLAKDKSLAELRTIQDWYVRYQLTKAHGVAEVASIGGFVQTYQVTVDPVKLRSYGIPLSKVSQVIRDSNRDVGGRVVEMAETEYMVRGKGYLRNKDDIELLVVKSMAGTPVLIRDIARVELAPDERRGLTELNGEGEVVSGIAMARYGQNALEVISNLKAKVQEISGGLPQGVTIQAVYDRSDLIYRAINTLKRTLIEESVIVAAVCIIFLLHVRSALVAIVMLPVGVLISFIAMRLLGMNSNLMSLGGIAIAIGAMVDAAIVMIENAHKHLERLKPDHSVKDRADAMLDACREVGRALFFSLLIITVSFLPVFTLESQEGRLFSPLAYTKTFAMAGAALLSVTLVPVLMMLFIRGKIMPEAKNPVNRFLIWIYRPIIAWVMGWKKLTIAFAVIAMAVSLYPASKLGSEFMPTLNEGTLLYMPASLPGMSITKAAEVMQTQDKIIKSFPEVTSVYGKAGRANTATDPAPVEMFETVINLKPQDEWRPGMTTDELIAEMDKALQFPGVSNAWTMPIKARIDMLSTGIRTPIGIKVFGKDLVEMERLAKEIEAVVKKVPGTTSAFAERITGGSYFDIEPDREQLARYGLSVGDLQEVIGTALGGEMVTTTVEGRERFGVTVRYPRELRSNPQQIEREVLVTTMSGAMIPLGEVARVKVVRGTPGIRTENALLSAYIFIDIRDRDIGSYVADARKAVTQSVKFPPGYYITWSGQFEYMERAIEKMKLVIPVTLLTIFLLLYLNFRRMTETLIVMLSVPFALIGGVWLMWLLGYNVSVAVAVGFIALAGVAAETGVVMLIYLDHAWEAAKLRCREADRTPNAADLYGAVMEGAVERVRPKMMTVVAIMAGLLPIMWGTGTGSEVMSRIAAPMVGGMISSTVLTLAVIPALYALVKEWQLRRTIRAAEAKVEAATPAIPRLRPDDQAVSGRLAVLALLLVLVVWFFAWLVTAFIRTAMPWVRQLRDAAVAGARGRSTPLARGTLALLDPARPGSQALLLGAVLLLAAGWLFLGVLEDVLSHDPLVQVDLAVFHLLQDLRTPSVDRLMIVFTEMGSVGVLLPLAISVALWMLWRRSWHTAAYWIGVTAFSEVLVQLLKFTLGRRRPLDLYTGVEQFSFPSGHAVVSTVMLGFLAFLLARRQTISTRLAIGTMAALYVALVAFSRLYLGAHWLSDVIGGISLGVAWIAVAVMVYAQRGVDEDFRPRGLMAVVAVSLLIFGGFWVNTNSAADLRRYAPADRRANLSAFAEGLENETNQYYAGRSIDRRIAGRWRP